MINASSAFRQALQNDNRNYIERVTVTLEDGTVLELDNSKIWGGGFSVEDAVSDDNSFTVLGSAIINTSTFVINNIYDDYSDYDFTNATFVMRTGLELESDSVTIREVFKKGTYTVDEAKYNGSIITITGLDNMSKFDRPYSESTLIYPATADTIVRDACTKCGVNLATLNFPNKSVVIEERPTDDALTFREVLSYVGQIVGCYCRCNPDGNLELKWFESQGSETDDVIDGGIFDASTPYATGAKVDGGLFLPWNVGDAVDCGTFDDERGQFRLSSIYNADVGTDDVVITGVRATYTVEVEEKEETQSVMSGENGYVIELSGNPFITEKNAQETVNRLGVQLIGIKFRKATVSHSSNPTIEAGDIVMLITSKGETYPIYITRTVFSVGSPQTTVCGAETPARKSAARYSAITKAYVETRKRLENQKTTFEQALENLSTRLDNANGLYETQITTESGGKITYMHNKPLLEESDIQIMISDVGVTVTANGTDSRPTWYGLTVDGELIANILNTVGVNADWINTGQLVISKDGREVLFADVDTGTVRISGESISITAGDALDKSITTKSRSVMDNANAYGLGWRVNASTFTNENKGECYYHGFNSNGEAADVNGWTEWNGSKVTIPKGCHINPNSRMPFDTTIYNVYRTSNQTFYDVVWIESSNKWEACSYSASTPSVRSSWLWNESTDIVLSSYSLPAAEGAIYAAILFRPAKKYSELVEVASGKAKTYTDSTLSGFAETVAAEFEDVQAQLDGMVDTYYYDYEPTASNYPANEWNTETLKLEHEGDLFLDTSTGKSYRWLKENNNWIWKEIPDTAAAQALLVAQNAQDTADGKRRVFLVQPTPPYDSGDLWMQGANGDILVCTNTKATGGSYAISDWTKLNKYTDDTVVNELQIGGKNLIYGTNGSSEADNNGYSATYFWNASSITEGEVQYIEIEDPPINGIKYGAKWVRTTGSETAHLLTFYDRTLDGAPFTDGQTYTVSAWVKTDTAGVQISAYAPDVTRTYKNGDNTDVINETNKWIRISKTFTVTNVPTKTYGTRTFPNCRLVFGVNTGSPASIVYMCGFKMEVGDKATDWTEYEYPVEFGGGRNLLRNTETLSIASLDKRININGHYADAEGESGIVRGRNLTVTSDDTLRSRVTTNGSYAYIMFGNWSTGEPAFTNSGLYGLEPGKTYTFSADVKCKLYSGVTGGNVIGSVLYYESNSGETTYHAVTAKAFVMYYIPSENGKEKTGKAKLTFTVSENASKCYIILRPQTTTASYHLVGDYIEAWNFKLEEGNHDTAWSPAPEDLQTTIEKYAESLGAQIDEKAETWYQTSDPSTAWTTSAMKTAHIGDLWYNSTSSVQRYYRWDGSEWEELTANPPKEVFDEIDGKAQVFISQPTPPYDVGDLWVQGSGGDIMKCKTARATGNYVASDWEKASKYTDDSALSTFLSGAYTTDKTNLQTQIDGKAETWYRESDPSSSWTTTALKQQHIGDLWYRTTDQTTWYYNGTKWVQQDVPTAVFDKIDGKAQVFTAQPTPPYDVGDLWFNSATSDIMTCVTKRASGSYTASDWAKRNKYTDDTTANTVKTMVQSTYGTCSTASATAAKVVTLSNFTLYTGARVSVFFTNANTAASPTLNVNSTGAKSIYARGATISSQYYWSAKSLVEFTYNGGQWVMENAQSQQEVFNALTNGGQDQGIYLKDGKLYLNFEYSLGKTLVLGGANNANGILEIRSLSGTRVGRWDNSALYIGNIGSSLTSPNTKVDTNGNLTSKSITANDYIFIEGNPKSSIKIPTNFSTYNKNLNYTMLYNHGLKYAYSEGPYYVYLGPYPANAAQTGWVMGTFICANAEYETAITKYSTLHTEGFHVRNGSKSSGMRADSIHTDGTLYSGGLATVTGLHSQGNITCNGSKNRIVDTNDYGERLLYAYETPSPLFGDMGEGIIGDDGKCYIQIDSIFAETVTLDQYQVFLQKYGDGDCWISERNRSYFVVAGTPSLSFGWEIKAKQADFSQYRLEKKINTIKTENETDYADLLKEHIYKIEKEREVTA